MKKEIRRKILALRKSIPENVLVKNSEKIIQKVKMHQAYQNADTILAYIDVKGEVKTKILIEDTWKNGKRVAVPKVHGDIMKFYFISSFEQLEEGTYGILEPKESCELMERMPENAVVIMPGVAFDRKGNRIGYGKGYYDRYFSQYPNVYKIAIAFTMQMVSEIPSDIYDIKADCVLTEEL